MKRIIAFLCWLALAGFLAPVPDNLLDGLSIVDEADWEQIPRPPHPLAPPRHWPPPPLRPAPRVYAPLIVVYQHENEKIDAQVPPTSQEQEFYNPNDQQL